MRRHPWVTRLLAMALPLCLSSSAEAASLELYGTFHAMGVIVTLEAGEDPDRDGTAAVAYRTAGRPFEAGFPLSRVADDRFVGSLFWLQPGTVHDVRVTLTDPDGAPLDGTILTDSGTTRDEIRVPAPDASYCVSPAGSGTACTPGAPCALETAIGLAQPGEAVVLRGGVYHTGGIVSPRSGTAAHPIQVRAYPGETPILDGSDPDSDAFAWSPYQNGVYVTTVHADSPHYVMADGARLFPYDDLTDLENLSRDGMPGFHASGTTLYVHLAGDQDPGTADMVISRHNHCFLVERDHLYFLELTFRHYGQGSWPKVFYLNNASDNLIQGCTFENNDLGVGIKRASHRNVIQDNVFSDVIFDWSWDDVKEVGGLEDGGVAFYDPVNGRGNIIRRNTFHDDFDGFGACPGSAPEVVTSETDVYGNRVYNMGDDGMETDGECGNVRIWGNVFHDVLMGISLAPAYTGPTYAIRNLVYRTGVGNNGYTGSPFKFNSGYGQSGPMYLFHNTADAALPGNNGLYVKAPGTWRMIYARNNVWAGTAFAVENYNAGQPIDLDHDDVYNAGAGDLVRWDGVRYATLAAFAGATGQETGGLSVDPGFRDPAGGDYRLGPGSALIDRGQVIPGINSGYRGAAPDIGAFESSGGPPGAVWLMLLGD